jgi:membrane protease YdiL (CAAX protease family)
MPDYPWLDPHVSVGSTLAAGLVATYLVVAALIFGRRAYARLVAARARGDHAVVRRRYRATLLKQAAMCALVLVIVAADPGVDRADVGLVWVHDDRGHNWWGWFGYGCVMLAVSAFVLRVWARRGRWVPGQKLFAALVARDGERGAAAAVAVGAGIAEELLFRGLFLAVLVDRFDLSPITAVVILSVVFGAVHVYQGWLGVLGTGLAGVLFGALYLGTQSLFMPIVFHVLVDLRALVFVPVSDYAAAPRRAVRP